MFRWNVSSRPWPLATYGESSTSASPAPAGQQHQPRPGHRPELRGQRVRVGRGQVADGADAEPGELLRRLGADAPQRVGRPAPSTSNQVADVSRNTPAGLPNPVAILACSLFSPIPTVQSSCGLRPYAARQRPRERLGIVGTRRRRTPRPSRAPPRPRRTTAARPSPSPRPPRRPPGPPAGTRRPAAAGRPSAAAARSARRAPWPRRTRCSPRRAWSGRRHRPPRPGRPRSSGCRSTSTAAMNWSRSTCSTHRPTLQSYPARARCEYRADGTPATALHRPEPRSMMEK